MTSGKRLLHLEEERDKALTIPREEWDKYGIKEVITPLPKDPDDIQE